MKRRQGFTLVELLVSMALIIFIMAILSQAFVAALGTFRNLKAQGDLAEKLRGVSQVLQRDLAADHFNGKKRLSDADFWLNGPPSQGFFRIWQSGPSPGTTPELTLLKTPAVDLDGLGSYISTQHYLAFTIKKRGNDMGDFLSASAPPTFLTASASFGPGEARYQGTSGGSYNYQWGEVAWFLQPQINPTTGQPDMTAPDPTTGSVPIPLYTLCRRQCLLVPDNDLVTVGSGTGGIPIALASNCLELSCWANGTNLYFNSPVDITVPWRRFGMVPLATSYAGLLYGVPTFPPTLPWPQTPAWVSPSPTPPVPWTYTPVATPLGPLSPIPYYPTLAQQSAPVNMWGADMQLNDVISFDVRVLVPGVTSGNDPFVTLWHPTFTTAVTQGGMNNYNPAFYNPANPTGPMVFDTWTNLSDSFNTNYYATWNLPGPGTPVTAPALPVPANMVNPYPLLIPGATTPGLTSIPLWGQATWNAATSSWQLASTGPSIQAIQITIRIWDFKTSQTRQVTIVQAM